MQNLTLKQVITFNETEKIIKAIEQPDAQVAVAMIAYAGLRINEVKNLKMSDIDMRSKQILIRSRVKEKYRSVPFTETLNVYLEKYTSNNIKEDVVLFPSREDYGTYLNHVLYQVTNNLGWDKKVTWKTLRRSYALNLFREGVDILTISYLLGQISTKNTVTILNQWMGRS